MNPIHIEVEILKIKVSLEDKSVMLPPLRDLAKGNAMETAILELMNESKLDIATLHTVASQIYLATLKGLCVRAGDGAAILSFAQLSYHLKIKEILVSSSIHPTQNSEIH